MGERLQYKLGLTPPKQKTGGFLNAEVCCRRFINWHLSGGEINLYIFRTGVSFANWRRHSSKLGSPSHRKWETKELSSWMFAFQGNGSQVIEEAFLNARRLTSLRDRECIYNYKLSKVATLRKGSLVVYNQVLAGTNSKLFCQYSLEKKTEPSGIGTYVHIHKCTCIHNLLSRIGSYDYRSWEVPRSRRINEVILVWTRRPENHQNWWYKFWSDSQTSQDKKNQNFHMSSKSGKYGYSSSRQSGRRNFCLFKGG